MDVKVRDKVIVRDNDWTTKAWSGTVVRFEKVNDFDFPVVRREGDGSEYVCAGQVVPFKRKVWDNISNMSPQDQWVALGGAKYWVD